MEIRPQSGMTISPADKPIWEAATKLEASFLSEMLKSTGLGEVSEEFGGGIGEEQFASFMRDAQAKEMVRAGGLGLAETFFHALKEKSDGTR